MDIKTGILTDVPLRLEPAEFVSRDPQLKKRISPRMFKIIRDMTSLVHSLANPAGYFRIEKIRKRQKGSIFLSEQGGKFPREIELKLNRISAAFNHCEYAVAYICTIGERVEERIEEFCKKGDPLRTWLFDSVCSYLAEKLAERVQKAAVSRFKNMKPTNRFSPGYCDWHITQQKKLFCLFTGMDIAVSLNSACMMIPRKSISGLFGLCKKTVSETIPCKSCPKKDCPSRRG
ncbi:MAG: vitamin B12 dependent-methionine synthase activation domain-containing protein [bacterium]